ncbi:hypothetical protein XA68_11723 [Ophiocordyceps unilateralis]|uniref:C3H1-type domain-containing protein n=1 Tax=Ophiocordyceps unilateralis TaxID=268505 RepID=A0A2A9PG84_OPHUN|nr:hypothetical protein XA68_11723 [Ophiocordyceps unilateralis]
MLFSEEDAPLLKAWIVKRIENTSDADSDVLAEYVIALLKHDGSHDDVRKLCEQEIPDFLTEDPKTFLDDVFAAIRSRSFHPGMSTSDARPATDSTAQSTTGARKRAFGDTADVAERHQPEHRSHKQPRRGGRRGGLEESRGGAFRSMPPSVPHFDASNPMEAMLQMQQAMGVPFAALQGYPQLASGTRSQRNQSKVKGRCRDFDTKGFCSRGSTCIYDHGNESIYVPPVLPRGPEYDPNDAVMHMPTYNSDLSRGRGGKKVRGNGNRGARKGSARAPFSAEGPVNDRSKSTIVVENIPEESFSEHQVRAFFSQFGTIVDISMQPYKHLAIVKFDKWAAANDAHRSPKVIFDNRFVKVYWYKEETSQAAGVNDGSKLTQDSSPPAREPEPEMDPEELQRKQLEAQRQHAEKKSLREELERQRQELEKRQQHLLAKHQAETEQLRARLAEKNDGGATTPSSGTQLLRAKLAALEQEAKMLGLDPQAADDGSAPPYRGGYRGRRGYRARGGHGPFRGQGPRHAAYAQYSLDNRPKKLTVHGVDFTPPERNELLRHFLLNLGEFESVETTPSVTHVSFQDRRTAEKFYYSLHGKELPGVDGKLDLSWVTGPGTAMKSTDGSTPGLSDDTPAGGDDDDVGQGPTKYDVEMHHPMDMDYEVGDDDAWDDAI